MMMKKMIKRIINIFQTRLQLFCRIWLPNNKVLTLLKMSPWLLHSKCWNKTKKINRLTWASMSPRKSHTKINLDASTTQQLRKTSTLHFIRDRRDKMITAKQKRFEILQNSSLLEDALNQQPNKQKVGPCKSQMTINAINRKSSCFNQIYINNMKVRGFEEIAKANVTCQWICHVCKMKVIEHN